MEPADTPVDRRYSLCTMGDGNTILAITQADDLAGFLPLINATRSGQFMLVDHSPNVRAADHLAQYVPELDGFAVARFGYTRIELLAGIGRGNGRNANGQYTPSTRFAHANPFTAESLDHAIETFYQFHAEKLAQLSAAQ